MNPAATDTPDPNWRRTLHIMVFCQLMTSIGFSSIFPFLSLYVKSLGSVTSLGTELLAGMVFSCQALTMMIASPVWGVVADRWGRKPMVERAMFGGAAILLLMAFARSAEELVVLRAVQGLITGTIGAANALVAAVVPRERTGYAMGLLQVGIGVGVGVGPVIGGAAADIFGYRAAFYVTSALLAVAGVIVHWGVREKFEPLARPAGRRGFLAGWRQILAAPGVSATYSLRFLDSLARMAFVPILPFYALELVADDSRVNSFTGLVIGSAAAAAAVFGVFIGRAGRPHRAPPHPHRQFPGRLLGLPAPGVGDPGLAVPAAADRRRHRARRHHHRGGCAAGALHAARGGGRGVRAGQLHQRGRPGAGPDDRRHRRHMVRLPRGVCVRLAAVPRRRAGGAVGVAADDGPPQRP